MLGFFKTIYNAVMEVGGEGEGKNSIDRETEQFKREAMCIYEEHNIKLVGESVCNIIDHMQRYASLSFNAALYAQCKYILDAMTRVMQCVNRFQYSNDGSGDDINGAVDIEMENKIFNDYKDNSDSNNSNNNNNNYNQFQLFSTIERNYIPVDSIKQCVTLSLDPNQPMTLEQKRDFIAITHDFVIIWKWALLYVKYTTFLHDILVTFPKYHSRQAYIDVIRTRINQFKLKS
jgi:hypothetical protein